MATQIDEQFEQSKEITKVVWTLGDYDEMCLLTKDAAPMLMTECGVAAGQDVLEVGAGNGNFSLLAAAEGARVTACDLTPKQVERGRARSEAAGLEIEWLEADAEELPFPDDAFDRVVTSFSAMYAPRPEKVASELFRVVRPGGVVGMANWTPEGFFGEMVRITEKYSPAPFEEVPSADDWGVPDIVAQRFGDRPAELRTERRHLRYTFPSIDDFWAFLKRCHGVMVGAEMILDEQQFASLTEDLHQVFVASNKATDGSLIIDAEFLLVVAQAR